jgi:hypothetical protein
MANSQLGRISEVDTAKLSQAANIEVENEMKQHTGLELNEAVIARGLREIIFQVSFFHLLFIVILKTFVSAVMIQYFYTHHF